MMLFTPQLDTLLPLRLARVNLVSAYIWAIAVVLSVMVPPHGWAEEPLKSPYLIRFGTIEINADRSKNYIFRWDGHEEVFDTSVNALLSRGGVEFPGLPDLKESGVKTASGKVFKYNRLPPDVFFRRFTEQHPGEAIIALVFEGKLDQDLELKLSGRTPVCRVDISADGRTTTLWRNVPNQDGKAPGGITN